MAYKLQLKRGLLSALPIGISGEPLFTTDTNDLYISNGTTNQKFQKFIASGISSQFLKGDGSLDSTTYQPLLTNPVTGTGTTNYLPKWTSGSAIGDSLVFDNGTNVGIGTASPGVILDIASSGTGIVRVKGGNSTNQGAAYYVGGNAVTLGAIGDRSAILGGTPEQAFSIYTGTVPLLFDVAAAERMRITSSGLVGIGTTNPNSNGGSGAGLLHINGAAAGAWAITHYTNGTTGFTESDGFIVGSIGADAYIFNYENSPILFGTNSSERLRITSGGNLLVGSSVDSGEKLQVSGSAKVSASDNDYVGLTLLNTNNNAILATSSAIKLGITSTVGTHYGTLKITENTPNDNTADFTLSLPFGGVESTKLTVLGNGNATFTSSVTATSFIKSGGTSSQYLMADGSVTTGGGGGGMAIGGTITSATVGSILFAGTSGVLAQNNANFFWDNTNFRLGIGTTTPSEKIHIVGNLLISNGSQTTTFSNKKGASNNGLNIWIGNGGVNTSGTGAEGSDNISMGRDALLNLSTGFKSIAIGNQALQNLTNAGNNIAIGYQTLLRITSGSSNVSIGGSSGSNITTAEDNTILGHSAMTNSNSNGNVAIGKFALNSTNGDFNTAVGYLSLFVSTGASNTSVGTSSLRYNSSGSNNTAIGVNAGVSPGIGSNTTGSNNIFIGYQSYGPSSTESNRTFIGNDSTVTSWIGGNLILGTKTTTGQRLQVSGDSKLSGRVNFTPQATPSTPVAGDVYYDSTSNKLRCYNGTSWNDLF